MVTVLMRMVSLGMCQNMVHAGQQQFELTSLQPILSPFDTSFETRFPPLDSK